MKSEFIIEIKQKIANIYGWMKSNLFNTRTIEGKDWQNRPAWKTFINIVNFIVN